MDVRQILENPSDFIGKHLKIEGYLTRNQEDWYIVLSQGSLDLYANKRILLERFDSKNQVPLPSSQERLSTFLQNMEANKDKKYSLEEVKYYYNAFSQTGALEYFDLLSQIASEDELATLFPYFSGGTSARSLYSQLNYILGTKRLLSYGYENEFFQATVVGKLTYSNIDKNQLILTNVEEVILEYEDCTYYINDDASYFDKVVSDLPPITPIPVLLTRSQEFKDQIVSIKGTFAGYEIYNGHYFIVPNTAYLKLKDSPSTPIMIEDFTFLEEMRKYVPELLGGKFSRVFDIYIIGKIVLSEAIPKKISLVEITTALIKDKEMIFKWNKY
jgi:hypothetical protein